MSIIEDEIKAIASEVKKSSFLRKIRILNYCSCMIIIFVFFNWKYWDVLTYINMPIAPLFSDVIRKTNIYIILGIWIAVWIIREVVRNKVVLEIDSKYPEKEYIIWYLFAEGVIDLGFSIICFVLALSMLVDYTHKIYPRYSWLLYWAIIYIVLSFIKKQRLLFFEEFRIRLKRGR